MTDGMDPDDQNPNRRNDPRCRASGTSDGTTVRCTLPAGHEGMHKPEPYDAIRDFQRAAAPEGVTPIAGVNVGAATAEAQENVALQVAEQMADYLLRGAISNAVNFPSISAEEAPKLKPFVALAEKLGSFAGQLTENPIKEIHITYEGTVAQMKIKALTSAVLAGLLRPMLGDVNVVSAPLVARERGMAVEETTREAEGDYESLITVNVMTEKHTRWVSGTVFADGRPRIVNIKGIRMDAEFGPSMIYITNLDKPGFIGKFSSTLGEAGINIATFHVGRETAGGNAIALIEIDGELPDAVLAKVRALPQVQQAKPLHF